MCGISGILNRSQIIADRDSQIEIMLNTQHMRGPDSSQIVSETNFTLAHNRLSIIDLNSTGNQPMESGDWLIVFNGEIYNYQEIKAQLELAGVQFNGSSDTEVLLKSIERDGIDQTLAKINGIFAFCIYNKISDEFYLVRDRLGEKPLFYYFDSAGSLYFASNPSSIVNALPNVEWILDREALWEYFAMGGIFTEKTLFSNIKRLDSASILSGNNAEFTISRYWTPQYQPNITDSTIDTSIKESIMSRTIADVPVVLFLSGGVDSSAVAAVIKDINAVHLISPEVEYAQQVANQFNIDFQIVTPESFDISKVLEEYATFSGEPTMAGFIPYITSKYVSSDYKVAISANGADELFFGYTRIPTPNLRSGFFEKRLLNEKININGLSFSPSEQILHIFRHPSNFSIHILESTKTYADLTNLVETIPKLSNDFPSSSQFRWLELMTYVKGDLNNTLDFSSMANSLEVRAPFLDYKLIQNALSIDETRHISQKLGRKHFLKNILLRNNINQNVWNRDKLGFSLVDSYLESIIDLRNTAVLELSKEGILDIHCTEGHSSRDLEYLKSAALGFYHWKKVWVDTGKVKIEK
jgi:asparagine synthase (glutamine-hydrolysing)